MKEFLSKVTFGFIMAQLFPGAVAVLSLTAPFQAKKCDQGYTVGMVIQKVDGFWFETPTRIIVLLFLAMGVGMLIHGIHWATLAWLENRLDGEPRPVNEVWYHRRRVAVQVLFAPLIMIGELVGTLFARRTKTLIIEENSPYTLEERFPAYAFMQEFYLYFGQFYAHTAYAMLLAILCATCVWTRLGWTWPRGLLLLGLYCACGVLFQIGRVQLGTLFGAEEQMKEKSTS